MTTQRIQEGGCTPQPPPELAVELIPVSSAMLVGWTASVIGLLSCVLPVVDSVQGIEVGAGIGACGAAMALVAAAKAAGRTQRLVALAAVAINLVAFSRGAATLW